MGKREATKQSSKAILAEVIKEMAKPKVVKSARIGFLLLERLSSRAGQH
jgi:hypothetical protein